jgi:di/tricarboxylate transporter
MGDADQLSELRQHQVETVERSHLSIEQIREAGLDMANLILLPGAPELGQTLAQAKMRMKLGVNVLAIRRGDKFLRNRLQSELLQIDDILLVQGPKERLASLRESDLYRYSEPDPADIGRLKERLLLVCVPPGSVLAEKKLVESNLGEAFGLTVLHIARDIAGGEKSIVLPKPEERVRVGDMLLVQGPAENIAAVRGLERLEIVTSPLELEDLETNEIGLGEAVLSPHTRLTGKTLDELRFRDKYGLNVLAILRRGKTYRHDLRDIPLRFGDALLLHGSRDKFLLLGTEPDFIVLTEEAQEKPNIKKAPLAVIIMAGVLVTVLVGWLPIAIAAVIGATVMVVTRCLTMEEAYRYISWPAVFLIAAMLPLGIAMQNSGATQFLADGMMGIVGDFGPLAVLAGLFLLSVLSSQVIPNAAVVVLMAPIAITTSQELGVSPRTFMMGIAIAASASFLSPVSHPANVLVMGPGGYRFSDYIKVGLPLTLLVFGIAMLILPLVWPF